MSEDANKVIYNIQDKLKLIDLDVENIPESLKEDVGLNYRVSKEFDDSTYKVYKYISVKDVQILISPVQRLASIKERYSKAMPIYKYFENKENRLAELMDALANTEVEDIEKLEKEQEIFSNKKPDNIKYKDSFKWQIYYSKNDDKYFMLVPIVENDNAALFYILKEKIKCEKTGKDKKIYVPICQEDYSDAIISKSRITEIENYLWFFTKKWPSIYEVTEENGDKSIHIIGRTNIYEKIESTYKIVLKTQEEADEKYKLIKALFIIASDLKYLYNFDTNINDKGELIFLYNEDEIEFNDLEIFIKEQVDKKLYESNDFIEKTDQIELELINLKASVDKKNGDYASKEKQILLFLQCKKTFIGRFKYFFKSNKGKKKIGIKRLDDIPKVVEFDGEEEEQVNFEEKDRYTIEDLLTICHIYEGKKTIYTDKLNSKKSLEDKIKILDKKIENADLYIQEIENHKRSIFEFWKFTNKDVPDALAEAERLRQNQENKIKRTFDYQEDLADLGKKMDELQKNKLSRNEIDSLFVAKSYIDVINVLCKNQLDNEDNLYISNKLAEAKENYDRMSKEKQTVFFDIFGNIDKEPEKEEKKETKEIRKDEYQIIRLDQKTTIDEFKDNLNKIKKVLEKEYNKVNVPNDIALYCLLNQNTMGEWYIANINPENIIRKEQDKESIDIIKYNVPENSQILFYTNCILYKGNNVEYGINEDSETLLYLSRFDRELSSKLRIRICIPKNEYENIIKNVKIYEYNLKAKEIDDKSLEN